jgi:hypothetical protein
MTEREYLLAGNLARVRAAMAVLRDVLILDNDGAADKCAAAFRALVDVERRLSEQMPELVSHE